MGGEREIKTIETHPVDNGEIFYGLWFKPLLMVKIINFLNYLSIFIQLTQFFNKMILLLRTYGCFCPPQGN